MCRMTMGECAVVVGTNRLCVHILLWSMFTGSSPSIGEAKLIPTPPSLRQTVIHFCAAQNFVEFLQDLAELGASIDIADNKGTCLFVPSVLAVSFIPSCPLSRIHPTPPGCQVRAHQCSHSSHQQRG